MSHDLVTSVNNSHFSHFSLQSTTDQPENVNAIPFLDTLVTKDSNGYLATSIYRKPTHADQYLAYDSYHPQSVNRGVVKCLYDRTKHLITRPLVISVEKIRTYHQFLFRTDILICLCKVSQKPRDKQLASKEPTSEIKCTAVLPYIKGVSQALRRFLRTVFKSDTTLRSHLVRPKDAVDPTKRDGVGLQDSLRMWQRIYWRDGKIDA